MNDPFYHLDGVAQAELVKRGEVSALELVDAAIARIDALEPVVHALAGTDFERARERAATAPSGPFQGVPFVIKDLLAYPGLRHSMGSRLFASFIADTGSPYSAALDAAGLVTLGKTTTSEFGLLGSTETLLEGITRNPWDLTRSAAGSSGGAAAAVASGMVPLAHATDGGGSIRIPASVCGLFGFMPSRGRCLRAAPPGGDLFGLVADHCVSRSVRDSACLLAATEQTAASAPHPPIGYIDRARNRRLRIGVYTTTPLGASPAGEVAKALAATVALCLALGHEVVDVPAPPVDGRAISDGFFTVAGAVMNGMVQQMEAVLGRAISADDVEPFTLALIDWYRCRPPNALEQAQVEIQQQAAVMRAYLDQAGDRRDGWDSTRDGTRASAQAVATGRDRYDVFLCPTIPILPLELGALAPTRDRAELIEQTELLAGYTSIHNFAGVPAMSVPLYWSAAGLPIGSHFAARAGDDATLLELAYQLEQASPWRDRWPAHSAHVGAAQPQR